jgi:Tfp pilus assembly protein PilF
MQLELQLPITINIATCFHKTQQLKKAIHLCNYILETHPRHLPTLEKKVYFLIQDGNYEEAKYIPIN